jgi:hypothetical protein
LTGCPLFHLSLHLAPDVPDEEKPVTFTTIRINYNNDTNMQLEPHIASELVTVNFYNNVLSI